MRHQSLRWVLLHLLTLASLLLNLVPSFAPRSFAAESASPTAPTPAFLAPTSPDTGTGGTTGSAAQRPHQAPQNRIGSPEGTAARQRALRQQTAPVNAAIPRLPGADSAGAAPATASGLTAPSLHANAAAPNVSPLTPPAPAVTRPTPPDPLAPRQRTAALDSALAELTQPGDNLAATNVLTPTVTVSAEGSLTVTRTLVAQTRTAVYLPLIQTSGTPTSALPVSTTLLITPDQGGTLRSADGRVQVVFPAGAVTAPTTITLQILSAQATPGYQATGLFFTLNARDAQGQPVTPFTQGPLVITQYADTLGLVEGRLQLYAARAAGPWQPIASQVDPQINQVTATLTAAVLHGAVVQVNRPASVVTATGDAMTTFALLVPNQVPITGSQTITLCAGTELWASPGDIWHNTVTPFVVPENNYAVMLINPNHNSPYAVGGVLWWNTSRKVVTNTAGDGTGWVSEDQLGVACQINDPGIPTRDVMAWLRAMRAKWRQFGYRPATATGGDPVNTATGNFLAQHTDVQVPGVAGFDLVLQRVYNSQDSREGAFGLGWSSLLDTSVTGAPDGSVDVRYPDGHGAAFTPGGAGYTPLDPGVFDTLTQAGAGFTLTTPDQITYTFDAKGYLVTLSERHGNTITVVRDGAGHATSITDSAGRTFTLSVTGDQVTAISDPAGRTWSYTYDGTNLAGFTDANGGTWRYTSADQRITALVDPEGITYLQNTYDGDGRVVSQRDAAGSQSSFSYTDGQTTFRDNLSHPTIYTYDDRKRTTRQEDALGQAELFTYADDNTRTAFTDKNGHTWTYTYDARGNRLTTTDPLGHTVSATYNATNDLTSLTDLGGPGDSARTTTYAYNGVGDVIRIAQPDGTMILATSDGRGQRLTQTDANDHTTTFSYDGQGNRVAVADPLGQTTRSAYDAVGRRTSVTDANEHTTQLAYDGNNNLTALTDPKGQRTTFAYDGNDTLVTQTDRRGGVTTYAYDVNLKLIAETDPEGHTTRYAYDAMYNRVSLTDPRGNVTQYRYDSIYRLTAVEDALAGVTHFAYDPNGNVTSVTNALGTVTRYVYDVLNRQVTQTDALNGVTTFVYDAVSRQTQVTNPRGAVTRVAYDLLDRPLRRTDALDGVQTIGYDPAGNLICVTDANSHTTTLGYDAADRRITQTDPERHLTTVGYDAVGNTTVITDALGRVTRAAYDANDNTTVITDALDGVTTLAYDAEDTLVARTDANDHTTRFVYDRDGLLITLTEAGGQVSHFAYDATHNRISVTNAKGNTWSATYDVLNRQISATDPLTHTTGYGYDALSRQITVVDANGITTGYRYDALDRLVAVVQNERPGLAADHETNVITGYAYDAVGNLTATTDGNRETTTFSYDLLDRLTQEVNPLGHTWRYAYDAVGNLTQRTDANGQTTTYRYDADDLLVHTGYPDDSGVSYAYDAVHNQTAMTDTLGLTRNDYDALNRLVASTNHVGQRVGYAYDAVGNRSAMTYPDGREVQYAYDPTDFAIQITDPDGHMFRVTRDLTHNVVRVENPNETVVERDIDAAERLTAIRNLTNERSAEESDGDDAERQRAEQHLTSTSAPEVIVISSVSYTLDPVGNRTQTVSIVGDHEHEAEPLVTDYRYDPLYRLVRSDDNDGQVTTYGHDAVNNIVLVETVDDATSDHGPETVTTTSSYDAANELITSVRAVAPRDEADRAIQTAQALRAFAHEVAAQRGIHIAAATADNLLTQAQALITALEAQPPPHDSSGDRATSTSVPANDPPTPEATAAVLATLRTAVTTAQTTGQVDRTRIATSLLFRLSQADEANRARGPVLQTTLYTYDANGSRIERLVPAEDSDSEQDWHKTAYTYDYENRLTRVQEFQTADEHSSSVWELDDTTLVQFDGYGRVFRRQHDLDGEPHDDQPWVSYVYDGLDPIVDYAHGDDHERHTNYYRWLGHILSQQNIAHESHDEEHLTYYHYDGLDSVTALTDDEGERAQSYRYNDYGVMVGDGHASNSGGDTGTPYTYTGQQWDAQLNLYHFYARDYEPTTGVWLQQDPYRGRLPDPKTLHRYGYVGANPVTYSDWLGFAASGMPYPTPVPTSKPTLAVGCGINMSCVSTNGNERYAGNLVPPTAQQLKNHPVVRRALEKALQDAIKNNLEEGGWIVWNRGDDSIEIVRVYDHQTSRSMYIGAGNRPSDTSERQVVGFFHTHQHYFLQPFKDQGYIGFITPNGASDDDKKIARQESVPGIIITRPWSSQKAWPSPIGLANYLYLVPGLSVIPPIINDNIDSQQPRAAITQPNAPYVFTYGPNQAPFSNGKR